MPYFFISGSLLVALGYWTFVAFPRALRTPAWTAGLARWSRRRFELAMVGAVLAEGLLIRGLALVERIPEAHYPGPAHLATLVYAFTCLLGLPAGMFLVARRWTELHPPAA